MSGSIGARFFPEIAAGGFSRVDGTVQFYQRVASLVGRQSIVLDFGAGRGAAHADDIVPFRRDLSTLKGRACQVIGADVDPVVETNPGLDRAVVIGADGGLPFDDRSIDVIVSDFTFEHLAEPAVVARELDRVLRPGGWLCIRTPNRYGYIAIANRFAPERRRQTILRSAQAERKEEDVFPAVYRINTAPALKRHFPAYDHHVMFMDGEPAYHFGSPALYALFLALHAMTPVRFKTTMLAYLRKRG